VKRNRGRWLEVVRVIILRLYGADAKNAAYALSVLADVVRGVPKHLAGAYCRCGRKLADEIAVDVEVAGPDVCERLCIVCFATGRPPEAA
jgi:hypothetical protein